MMLGQNQKKGIFLIGGYILSKGVAREGYWCLSPYLAGRTVNRLRVSGPVSQTCYSDAD